MRLVRLSAQHTHTHAHTVAPSLLSLNASFSLPSSPSVFLLPHHLLSPPSLSPSLRLSHILPLPRSTQLCPRTHRSYINPTHCLHPPPLSINLPPSSSIHLLSIASPSLFLFNPLVLLSLSTPLSLLFAFILSPFLSFASLPFSSLL